MSRRKSVTHMKHLVAEYWAEREPEFVPDLQRPACFACGFDRADWVTQADLKKTWDVRLEVAHIVPSACGGSDEVGNLVLLCRDCHRSAPSFTDPGVMLQWMLDRPTFAELMLVVFREVFSGSDIAHVQAERFESREFHDFAMANITFSLSDPRETVFRSAAYAARHYVTRLGPPVELRAAA